MEKTFKTMRSIRTHGVQDLKFPQTCLSCRTAGGDGISFGGYAGSDAGGDGPTGRGCCSGGTTCATACIRGWKGLAFRFLFVTEFVSPRFVFAQLAPVSAPVSPQESLSVSLPVLLPLHPKTEYQLHNRRARNTQKHRYPKNQKGSEHPLPLGPSPPVSPPVSLPV